MQPAAVAFETRPVHATEPSGTVAAAQEGKMRGGSRSGMVIAVPQLPHPGTTALERHFP
jgi:hypothetical protein